MEHYAGLDVSVKDTSVCVIDGAGKTIREVKVASEPEAILAVLADDALAIERIGLEAGPLSQWLYSGLAEAGLPVICVETRHMKAALSAQLNKSDRNDARGIAHMMRVGLYRPVHVKTLASQKRRMLLTSRQLLQAKALDIENDLRGTLRNFGLKVGMVGVAKFEARIRELVGRVSTGVGPIVALTFRATVDVPARFKNSKAVGAVFGLTPRRHQSGEIDRMGSISKCGDAMVRTMLFDAAQVMLTRTIRWSWLKAWGMKIARHRGMKRAIVAVARRMAVIMHRIWADGTEFRWTRPTAEAA